METKKHPEPFSGAVPSLRQLLWHELEYYAFLHFSVNTFTGKEWGYGHENPSVFNPSAFDAGQIAETIRKAGMKGLVLTCKHHDGFCLWPSRYTEHSVKNSPWRKGKGDVVREISDACHDNKLKFGVYLSPWDRNRADYGEPSYVEYFRKQLRELLSYYGPVFEVWIDGANGGDGFYGGTREKREIDLRSYYGWEDTWSLIRKLQPDACIASDAGPDIRWAGNEKGIAGDPCWHTLDLEGNAPGASDRKVLNSGERRGSSWTPAECDVSIRPGWFYHEGENNKVRMPENLMDLYFKSVGRGASLLLNVPPDRRGRIHDKDIASLTGFRKMQGEIFVEDLAAGARVCRRGIIYPGRADNTSPEEMESLRVLILDFPRTVTFNVVELREDIASGQRIENFIMEVQEGKNWIECARGKAIGNRRLIKCGDFTAKKIRLRILKSHDKPAIKKLGLFRGPGAAHTKEDSKA